MDKINKDYNKQSSYEKLLYVYQKYVEKVDKTEDSDSFARYQTELELLRKMKTEAEKESKLEQLEFLRNRYNILVNKLAQFGVIPNKL